MSGSLLVVVALPDATALFSFSLLAEHSKGLENADLAVPGSNGEAGAFPTVPFTPHIASCAFSKSFVIIGYMVKMIRSCTAEPSR